ncbi:hypothetical protein [Amycolatopsis sp. WGS_07]|uniref:hypothetical protein n=1 Tax=Amycolatopsis sp. WGS_07 TaxID=3076764 RepID=UPI0038730A31
MLGMDGLVRQGEIHYVAISNAPAWQISRTQAIADLRAPGRAHRETRPAPRPASWARAWSPTRR